METVNSNIKRLVATDQKYHKAPVFIIPKENEWGNFNKFKLQLLNKHKNYLETINKGIIQIEKDIKKNKLHTVDYYNSTLGIPVFIILKTLKNE